MLDNLFPFFKRLSSEVFTLFCLFHLSIFFFFVFLRFFTLCFCSSASKLLFRHLYFLFSFYIFADPTSLLLSILSHYFFFFFFIKFESLSFVVIYLFHFSYLSGFRLHSFKPFAPFFFHRFVSNLNFLTQRYRFLSVQLSPGTEPKIIRLGTVRYYSIWFPAKAKFRFSIIYIQHAII